MLTFSSLQRADRAGLAGWAVTIGAHAAIVLFLLTYAPAREALSTLAPLMVDLIKPALSAPPTPKLEPKIELPKPLPVKRVQPRPQPEPAVQPTVLAAQTTAPTAVQVPLPPEAKPAPPVEARPTPPAPPALPAPVSPPNFNANYLDNPAPSYPALSRRTGEEGRVMLRVFVETDGLPSKLEVRASSGYERLDQSALEAVRRWKFVPAKQGDKAIAAWVVVPILFNLKG